MLCQRAPGGHAWLHMCDCIYYCSVTIIDVDIVYVTKFNHVFVHDCDDPYPGMYLGSAEEDYKATII